jgi:nitroreductase
VSSGLARIIASRRTTKDFDGSPLTENQLRPLLEAAHWAPNHGLNLPWRFRVVLSSGVKRFVEEAHQNLPADLLAAYSGSLKKLSLVGAWIDVSCLKDEHPLKDRENEAATAAAIQNVLLMATEQGLQSFWSTGKLFRDPWTAAWIGRDAESEHFSGALWLGNGQAPEAKKRPPVDSITRWIR